MRVPRAERTTHQRGNGTTTEKKSDHRKLNPRSRSSIPSENGRRSTSSPHYYSHKWSSIRPTPISSHDFLEPSYLYSKNQEMAYDPRMHDRTPLTHLRTHVPLVRMRIHHPIRHYEKHPQGHELGTGDTENHNTHFVERLGNVGVAQDMVGLVHDIFTASILAFVWHSGSTADPVTPSPLSPNAAIGPRVLISAFFFLGFVYFGAIVKTLQGYGRVSGTTRDTETARETGDAIREGRDEEKEREGERTRKTARARQSKRPRKRLETHLT
ncbi:hypothetical protein F5J12DRAFT_92363 [Pisolithus orientalis]|uniref:uncharacterized protein n=1 Tax=Pisolithus orientalis TaxID=936130 RepID=UPI0022247CEC|nr:uncharacterized protein F5J12DRAFT_92363 [Pisolithus orientalis]KAI5984126.1 hypothetical protein F5J12DRAFT_92363 [Pisolithus orientalis]